MAEEVTLKTMSEKTGVPVRKIMYRIKMKQVQARKVGWIWLLPVNQAEVIKELCSRN